jgi:hypothetical protein
MIEKKGATVGAAAPGGENRRTGQAPRYYDGAKK